MQTQAKGIQPGRQPRTIWFSLAAKRRAKPGTYISMVQLRGHVRVCSMHQHPVIHKGLDDVHDSDHILVRRLPNTVVPDRPKQAAAVAVVRQNE